MSASAKRMHATSDCPSNPGSARQDLIDWLAQGDESIERTRLVAVATEGLLDGDAHYHGLDRSMAQPAEQIRIVIEFVLALLILVVSMPIILIALVLVRATSRGPVIYAQKRLGRGGRVFTIYKIRTMYLDSEPNGPRWSVPGDPRITPVGRLLRWSHVDELPQLINIMEKMILLVPPRHHPANVGRSSRFITRSTGG